MNNAPIGVFDSGQGGLSVWSELYRRLPHESLLYYGDGKNCPYGNQPRERIVEYSDYAVRRMLSAGVKMVVIACNTATAAAIDHLRTTYDVPFVGLEPAVKPAVLTSRSGVVGILATAASLKGRLFRETSRKYADRARMIEQVGEGFVELVESDREDTPEAFETVSKLLGPMLEQGVDRIVLGCTHYPFVREMIQQVVGDKVTIYDGGSGTAREMRRRLQEKDLLNPKQERGQVRFYNSRDTEEELALCRSLFEK